MHIQDVVAINSIILEDWVECIYRPCCGPAAVRLFSDSLRVVARILSTKKERGIDPTRGIGYNVQFSVQTRRWLRIYAFCKKYLYLLPIERFSYMYRYPWNQSYHNSPFYASGIHNQVFFLYLNQLLDWKKGII